MHQLSFFVIFICHYSKVAMDNGRITRPFPAIATAYGQNLRRESRRDNTHKDAYFNCARQLRGRICLAIHGKEIVWSATLKSKIVASFSPGHGMREHDGDITVVDPKAGPDDFASARRISRLGNRFYVDSGGSAIVRRRVRAFRDPRRHLSRDEWGCNTSRRTALRNYASGCKGDKCSKVTETRLI